MSLNISEMYPCSHKTALLSAKGDVMFSQGILQNTIWTKTFTCRDVHFLDGDKITDDQINNYFWNCSSVFCIDFKGLLHGSVFPFEKALLCRDVCHSVDALQLTIHQD